MGYGQRKSTQEFGGYSTKKSSGLSRHGSMNSTAVQAGGMLKDDQRMVSNNYLHQTGSSNPYRSKHLSLTNTQSNYKKEKSSSPYNNCSSPKTNSSSSNNHRTGPTFALTPAQISEKIKRETDVNSRTAVQLNLLMNKTMKWVMTQDFERYRQYDEMN